MQEHIGVLKQISLQRINDALQKKSTASKEVLKNKKKQAKKLKGE